MLELLAPAGDIKSFYTAVNCGADAVYIGLGDFNARMKAENFDEDEIAGLIAHAHFYGVKVYVTVNTVVQNRELKDVLRLVKVAIEAKADAFIVQDIGVGKMLSECFPGIVLHLSTQGGVHNEAGARVAQKLGFKRVVLSRETKLEDIRAIHRETSLEIEYFVQGALCVAFSGNCYLSAVEQGASGNRGLCKQMCRLPYVASAGGKTEEAYMLSARELCLADSLTSLIDAGVTSFKIEGRMRRESYVGQAVKIYRKLLDGISSGAYELLSAKDEEALKISFGRGEFSKRAYLDDVPDIIEKKYNNHAGIPIGKVISVRPFRTGLHEVTLIADREVKAGDGLKFFKDGKEVCSLGVGNARNADGKCVFVTAVKVPSGAEVRLITDSALDAKIAAKRRYVPINISIYAMEGEPLILTATAKVASDDGYESEIAETRWQDGVLEKARTAPVIDAELAAQASKTADTGFIVEDCEVQTNGVFVAKSVVNGLRREVLTALKEKLIRARERDICADEEAIERYMSLSFGDECPTDASMIAVTSENVGNVRLGATDTALIMPSEYTAREVERMLDVLCLGADEVILQLPVVANGKDLAVIDELLGEMSGICSLMAENIYGIDYCDRGYMVIAGAGLNVVNDLTLERYVELGCNAAVIGLDSEGLCNRDEVPLFKVEGELPLMTFSHCPYRTLFSNDCKHCSYTGDMTLVREKHRYKVRRIRSSQCYFGLYADDSDLK